MTLMYIVSYLILSYLILSIYTDSIYPTRWTWPEILTLLPTLTPCLSTVVQKGETTSGVNVVLTNLSLNW